MTPLRPSRRAHHRLERPSAGARAWQRGRGRVLQRCRRTIGGERAGRLHVRGRRLLERPTRHRGAEVVGAECVRWPECVSWARCAPALRASLANTPSRRRRVCRRARCRAPHLKRPRPTL
eukprot:2799165-Prymnesium_polylepis.2